MSEEKVSKECAVCYEEKRTVQCFYKCSSDVCVSCIRKILSFNHEGKVIFKCPVCRRNSVNRKKYECENRSDRRFSRFCLTNPAITSKIFEMYEKETKKNLERNYDSDDSVSYIDSTVSLFTELEHAVNNMHHQNNHHQNNHHQTLLAMRENDFLNIQ